MRKILATTPLFTDVHGPYLHEAASKYEDLFKVCLKMCLYVLYMCWSKYRPNGSNFKKLFQGSPAFVKNYLLSLMFQLLDWWSWNKFLLWCQLDCWEEQLLKILEQFLSSLPTQIVFCNKTIMFWHETWQSSLTWHILETFFFHPILLSLLSYLSGMGASFT